MSTTIATSTAEGKPVEWIQEDDLCVHCFADMDVDADGANGQNGGVAAYREDDKGSELLANGGMKRNEHGHVVFAASWGKDIVLLDPNGNPLVLHTGVIPSLTAYRDPAKFKNDPSAYVDAETVPYIVVPPEVRSRAKGVVLGCKAKLTNTRTGQSVDAVVADIGPRNKAGEASIAAARAIGIASSPRTGGVESPIIRYELFPGTPAVVNGVTYSLIRA